MKKVLSLCVWLAVLTGTALAQAGPTPVPSSAPYTGTITPSQISPNLNATNIVPTSVAQGVFGGTYGYEFAPGVTTQVPLTLAGVTGQSADLFDVDLNATKEWWVDSTGGAHFALAPQIGTASAQGTFAQVASQCNGIGAGYTALDTEASTLPVSGITPTAFGINCNATQIFAMDNSGDVGFAGANVQMNNLGVNGLRLQPNADGNAAMMVITNAAGTGTIGRFDSTSATAGSWLTTSSANALGRLLPVYTGSGGVVGTTLHAVITSCTTSASTLCSVTFSGAAAFTSATSYACGVSNSGSNVLASSGLSGGTTANFVANTSGNYTLIGVCIGT